MSSTTTAIAIRDDQTTFDDLQKRALAHIGVETANPADLAVFFHTCKRTGLDPFARQIYMIRRDGKQTMQTGIDGLRLIAQRTAERTGETFGYEDTHWCGEDGVWRDVWLAKEPPAAAKATVVRNGQRFPFVALFTEYVQRKRDGDITKMWTEKGALMLAKCAEAGALRKAFPQDLSGIYAADEMAHQDTPAQPAAPSVTASDFNPAAETGPTVNDVQDAEVVTEEPPAEQPADFPAAQNRLNAMFAEFGRAGFTTDARSAEGRQARLDYCSNVIGRPVESSKDLLAGEVERVINALKADAADDGELPQDPA